MKKGLAYFFDFELETANITFYPRPETEILVEKAAQSMAEMSGKWHPYEIIDLGTGCGNIAIALTKLLPLSRILALDISEEIIFIAKKNAEKYGAGERIRFIKSDLFKEIGDNLKGSFDMIVSNPPYIAVNEFVELPTTVKDDPYIALYGGIDGLNFYKRIAEEARPFLKKNGLILLEIGYNQGRIIKTILKKYGFRDIEIFADYSGHDRIIRARAGD